MKQLKLPVPWDYETARLVLKRAAVDAYNEGRWQAAAHLYHFAATAVGIRTRLSFCRALRKALSREREEFWTRAVDVAQAQHEENMRRGAEQIGHHRLLARARLNTRSPIDHLVDEACGVLR